MTIEIGQPAPEFTLPNHDRTPVALADLEGAHSVLVFIPFPFSSVCTGELCEIRDQYEWMKDKTNQVVAITCDTVWSNAAWAKHEGYQFPILADYWPHGEVALAYGVFNEELGCANRATFLLDAENIVQGIFRSEDLLSPRALSDLTQALDQT